jgi:hypothetical protein
MATTYSFGNVPNSHIRKFRNIIFWPEDGMIKAVDERNDQKYEFTVKEFLTRIQHLLPGICRLKFWDDRVEHCRLVDDALYVCKIAQSQENRQVKSITVNEEKLALLKKLFPDFTEEDLRKYLYGE